MGRVTLALLLLASLTACSKVQARTPPASAELNTPAPPDRLVVPVPLDVPEPAPSSAPPAPTPPQPRNTAVPPARPPDKPSTPVTTPPATPPVEAPPPVLQTTANVSAIEQRVQDKIRDAQGNLARVVPTSLSKDARGQYNAAKRFVEIAQEAIRNKNYTYALQVATNAAAMAELLVKGH